MSPSGNLPPREVENPYRISLLHLLNGSLTLAKIGPQPQDRCFMANLILENLEYFLGFLRKQLDFSAATMLLFFCPYLWKGDESHQSESSRRFGKLEPAGRSSSSSKLIKNFRHFSKTPKLWLCCVLISSGD